MPEQQYFPVNWIDGMKINKSHFLAQENATSFQIAKTASSMLDDYNYGLLPSQGSSGSPLNILVNADNQQHVTLKLQHCRAITRGGYYFQLNDEGTASKSLTTAIPQLTVPAHELREKSDSLLIILTMNPYSRHPHGMMDPEESPARLPHTVASFSLDLLPVTDNINNLVGLFHLPVGKIKIDAQRVMLDNEYIPPCCRINSHTDLLDILYGLEQFYSKMEIYSLQIVQKIHQKIQLNDMSEIVLKLCDTMLICMASQISEIKTLAANQPPVYLINKLSSLARTIKNTIDYYVGSGKEELINYCAEWCNVSQTELETALTEMSSNQYNHLDVNLSIEKVLQFTRTISGLFQNLSKLDYIGKKKETGIFVKENIISYQPEEANKKRKSFLAD